MSNPISFDPLLVAYLARELDERLAGRALAALPRFGSERTAVLPLVGAQALRFDLHPTRGWVRLLDAEQEVNEDDAQVVCTGVTAPPDERRLEIALREEARFRSQGWTLVVELHTNQWNALLVDAESGQIGAVLWQREAGGRNLRSGAIYSPPPPRERVGASDVDRTAAEERWRAVLGDITPAERAAALTRHFAYTGPLNATPLLGEALQDDSAAALDIAFERWWWFRSLPDSRPVVLLLPAGPQPYPLPLPDVQAEPAGSLLEAMARSAGSAGSPAPTVEEPEQEILLERARERLQTARRRAERIRAELGRAGEAEQMRTFGDLLLAHLHRVPRGAESVRLRDWEDQEVEIALDPTRTPAQNADAWYEKARRRSRALERLPQLLAEAEEEASRWEAALHHAEAAGELPAWAAEELERSPTRETAGRNVEEPSAPYRRYRTSGGLEVRVGRSSKDNDRLTFGFSSPGDIWLHARSVPGSHVILRWPDPEGNPPARDLEEAAGLAALFSKSRTSGLVAVDWTRRKYVRKPRGAPPGAVIPQRVKTVFVEPELGLEERLHESRR
ncbi:MAG: DUF814 domain-containing protein [Gemmatimonadetes bacterium]|nr:DUF814 domain-containing protein [Gemmatimonadota bacterium]